jgi:uncharacterized membrane protein YphA (DoxX/SURF4 family)
MKKLLSNDYLTLLCRLVFGGIFIYAALDKITHPDQFARILFNYHLLPGPIINIVALVLPMSEFLAGIMLISGTLYPGARNYLIILLLAFMIAIGINVIRGVDLECGCFTVSSKAKSAALQILIRDIFYLIPGLVLLISGSRRWMVDNVFSARR